MRLPPYTLRISTDIWDACLTVIPIAVWASAAWWGCGLDLCSLVFEVYYGDQVQGSS